MVNEKARYQEIANEDSEMFMAANNGIITYDEYYESNSVASAIEEIWRMHITDQPAFVHLRSQPQPQVLQ